MPWFWWPDLTLGRPYPMSLFLKEEHMKLSVWVSKPWVSQKYQENRIFHRIFHSIEYFIFYEILSTYFVPSGTNRCSFLDSYLATEKNLGVFSWKFSLFQGLLSRRAFSSSAGLVCYKRISGIRVIWIQSDASICWCEPLRRAQRKQKVQSFVSPETNGVCSDLMLDYWINARSFCFQLWFAPIIDVFSDSLCC